MIGTEEQTWYMNQALGQAQLALESEEVPVGCVIVDYTLLSSEPSDKESDTEKLEDHLICRLSACIIGRGHNLTNQSRNGTRHAEIVAIDEIMIKYGRKDLSGCDLYVTCEPCILCAAAIGRMNIRRVNFGCKNERFGGNGSILSVHNSRKFGDICAYDVYPGLMETEAIALFQTFYTTENRRAPESKRKRKYPNISSSPSSEKLEIPM